MSAATSGIRPAYHGAHAGYLLVMEHRCEPVQLRIAEARGLNRLRGGEDAAVDAGLAVSLQHVAQLLGQRS